MPSFSSPPPSDAPEPLVLRTRCHFAGSLWCRAVLTPTAIEFRGWTFRGSFSRTIDLGAIAEATWQSRDARGAVLKLVLDDGAYVEAQMRGAALWKLAIDERTARPEEASEPVAGRRYVHRALYHAPDFGTQLAQRPLAPLLPIRAYAPGGDGARFTPNLS